MSELCSRSEASARAACAVSRTDKVRPDYAGEPPAAEYGGNPKQNHSMRFRIRRGECVFEKDEWAVLFGVLPVGQGRREYLLQFLNGKGFQKMDTDKI